VPEVSAGVLEEDMRRTLLEVDYGFGDYGDVQAFPSIERRTRVRH
jgi:hypothetical protein